VSGRRRRLSAVGRVALAVTLVLAFGVGTLVALAYGIVLTRLQSDVDSALLREADAYAAAIGGQAAVADEQASLLDSSRGYLSARGKRPASYAPILLVRFADGRVVSNSEVPIEQAPADRKVLESKTAMREFNTLAYDGQTYRTATVPIVDTSGTVLAMFQAALSVAPQELIAQQVGYTLLLTGTAIVLLGAALSAFVARGALAPLHDVARTAEGIGQRSLSTRVDYDGPNDDVGRMVGAFNDMLGRLEAAFGEQRRFVADASHELRTPLTIVRGHLDVLVASSEGTLTEDQLETLDIVGDELSRMSRLIEDLLRLARLETGSGRQGVDVELCSLASQALDKASALGDRRFEYHGASGGTLVHGDPDQLEQAILNLLSNAVSHTSSGGLVSLTCAAHPGRVTVEVADDGPGIRREDISRVFDRFYRSPGPRPADTGGSGLGLAITKRLVELHGGTVSADNRAYGGAVFTIDLPAAPAPGLAPPLDLPPVRAPRAGRSGASAGGSGS
jgi:two-component system, OmpR family, sensor kinase